MDAAVAPSQGSGRSPAKTRARRSELAAAVAKPAQCEPSVVSDLPEYVPISDAERMLFAVCFGELITSVLSGAE